MKTLRILVSLPTRDNDFQIEQASSAEKAARKLGITLEICYAKGGKIPVLVIMAKDFGVPQWLQHVLGRIHIFTIYELAADTQYGNLY